MELMKRLWKEEEGQGLVEYALIIALISLVIIVAGPDVYDAVKAQFDKIVSSLSGETDTVVDPDA